MLKKFAVIIFTLACFTTFLTIQQTSRYHLSMKMTAIDARIRRQRAIHTDTKLTHKSGMAMEKSSSNSNNARQIDKLVQKYYNNLFATDEYKAVGPKKRKPDMNNLLIPFLFYNMGPNNLFRIFKESIPIIHMMNRTLVVPPFHHHPRMKRLNEEDQSDKTVEVDVDIFDQTYRSFVETDAKKTVDMKTLQYIIPAIPIKRFHSTCGNKINTLITCGIVSGKRASGLTHFKQVTNLTVGRVFKVEHLKDVSSDKEWKMNVMTAVQNTKGQKCVGLVLGSKCLGSRGAWFRHWRSFAPFVRHPPKIQVLANLFTENVLKGEPFLAVHWRYENTDWQDMCKASRPDSVRKINAPVCELARQLTTNSSFLTSLAKKLHSYAMEKNLKHVFFAAPPQLTDTLEALKSRMPDLYVTSDVQAFAENNKFGADIFNNNFATSFLEQEICCLAKVFLGSPLSSWTQSVMFDRVARGNSQHSSLLEVLFKDSSTLPKLTWYFPEGV